MNKHKKGTRREEAGKADIKKTIPEGRPQPKKNENHNCEEYCIGKQ